MGDTLHSVDISPEIQVLTVLRHLNYKPWFAIAEFVDNAIQSYQTNKQELKKAHGDDYKLEIKITFDAGASCITIEDNAAGIALKDFDRAFKIASIPPDNTGLSEFGMGMKSAACWFSNTWNVRTTALDEAVERSISCNIEEIVKNDIHLLRVTATECCNETSYTKVVLDDIHKMPKGNTTKKIREHLTDIYRVFLRNGEVTISLDGEPLAYMEPNVLYARAVKDPDGEEQEWKQDIELDLGNGRSAVGFAGLLNPGSYPKAGFALFRRNRLIQGSADTGYRPASIFGHSTHVTFRLFGELHLSGFEVSHTKDGFKWDGNEDEFIEKLEEQIESLIFQAQHYRHRKNKDDIEKVKIEASNIAKLIKKQLPSNKQNVDNVQQAETSTTPMPITDGIEKVETTFMLGDEKWICIIEMDQDPGSPWLDVRNYKRDKSDAVVVEMRVAVNNPFMAKFTQNNKEALQALLRIAAGSAIAELLAKRVGVKGTRTIRDKLNILLEDVFSKDL